MIKKLPKPLFLGCVLASLVIGPFFDFARGGSPLALLSVNRGISPPLAIDCTIYAAANGNDGNDGTKHADGTIYPKTLNGAAASTVPGSVVCLFGGRYELPYAFVPPHGGSSSSWITYKNYGDGDVLLVWTGGFTAAPMINISSTVAPPTPYVQFIGLTLDGQGTALDGFFCRGNSSVRFYGNVISNTGGSGIGSQNCDYVTADHNIISHNGYISAGADPNIAQYYSWTSGISYNINQCSDSYDGLHLIISNNIIVGEVDQSPNHKDVNGRHTDGGGIILDYDTDTAPPVITCRYPPGALIVNNIVYGNGGRCIAANEVSNFWIVNNTCYKNGLDLSEEPSIGEFDLQNSTNGHFVNNISVAWQLTDAAYSQAGTNSDIYYFKNLAFGSCCSFACSDAMQWFSGDPVFVNTPYFDAAATADGQYKTARPPSVGTPTPHAPPQRCTGMVPTCGIVSGFGLASSSSPAYNAGIDPTTDSVLSARMSANLKAEMQSYIYADINGRTRTAEVNWDLGALAHKVD
ncbi:MAG: hypothetical protein DMG70_06115 [Acidobacteria bacterium]|nr:MAG: hypothetical protein DMG70_06115 [Acidobacteriota bacterium]